MGVGVWQFVRGQAQVLGCAEVVEQCVLCGGGCQGRRWLCAKSQPPRPSTRLYNTWVCSVFCTARGIDFERVHRRCSCWAKKCSADTSDGGVPGASTLGHTPEAAATLICTAFCTARAIDFAELARLSHECERLSSDCSLFYKKSCT